MRATAGPKVIKTLIYRLVDRFLGSYVQGYMRRNVYLGAKRGVGAIRRYSDLHSRYSKVGRWPSEVRSFEDLSFLFHSSQANYGICLLAFDEAAYLYGLVRTISGGSLAEIGRFRGGSTFLIAAAMDESSALESFDIHEISSVKGEKSRKVELDGNVLDRELRDALERYGLASKVGVLVQDSATVKVPEDKYALVFVDGDHSYEGAKRDFLNWRNAVKRGGHLLFHDAARTRKFSSAGPGLMSLMSEIEKDYGHLFARIDAVGSLVHFRRLD